MTDLTLKRAEVAEQCINRIQDYLEYAWQGCDSTDDLRKVIMGHVEQYSDEMREGCEDE